MIKSKSYAKTIVLYWDLPKNYVSGNKYNIYIDGTHIGETSKCHFKVCDLVPNTSYEFVVEMMGENSCLVGNLSCSTELEREKINVYIFHQVIL